MLRYDGRTLAEGRWDALDTSVAFQELVDASGDRVTQVLKWTSSGAPIRLSLRIDGSDEAFPVQADPMPRGLAIVRHAVGLSTSRLNRGVYDRRRDWLLSVDYPVDVEIVAAETIGGRVRVDLVAAGGEVALRFRPRYYQRHRGLVRYEPWNYRLPRDVPAGWTSWYAYRDAITEQDVHRVADVMAERLAPWGYRWLQLDDGYQQLPIGVVDHWLTPNTKFPSGMAALASYIRSRGLLPGIWTNVSFQDSAWSALHPQYFLRDADGRPAYGNWVGWVMDANNPSTFDALLAPVYRGFREMGYQYFKVDALRHLRYEGYNSHAGSFAPGASREAELRGVMARLRDTLGGDRFILACWGARPELIGLVDAMRIGDDGFGFGGLAQYNSFNNVVWRNDPDHIEVGSPDAYAAAMATTLTGSHLMLTDKAEVYRTARVDVARRTAPVLATVPGQVFDVDPSRSSQLGRADVELSGAGPRPLDADQLPVTHLFQLDIARPFERWSVLGRTGGESRTVRFADLGLPDSARYLVFEFWTRSLQRTTRAGFTFPPLDTTFHAQAYCIRTVLPHPQLVATDRHVTCGGPDLESVTWHDETLEGRSQVVAGEGYTLYVHEPAGTRFRDVRVTHATVSSTGLRRSLRNVRLQPTDGEPITWALRYERPARAPGGSRREGR
ncbi:MAG: alpha-galactosidase [Gemmatimonadaceae bacterium]